MLKFDFALSVVVVDRGSDSAEFLFCHRFSSRSIFLSFALTSTLGVIDLLKELTERAVAVPKDAPPLRHKHCL